MADKYKIGKIYTIRCKNDDTRIYVGSTIQPYVCTYMLRPN
jgi:hypothetical protein